MVKRKDGIETRERILRAACEVFAERGYHDATVAQICRQAGTNVAAVSYYFGSKDDLYAEVWRRAWREARHVYPPGGGVEADAPPAERLRGAIHSLVGKTVGAGQIGHSGRLLLREIVSPTEVIQDVRRDVIHPQRQRMRALVAEMLGPAATAEQVSLCAMSIVHQAFALGIQTFTGGLFPDMKLDLPPEELVETLTDHITRFCLGGIEALRKSIQNEACV